MNGRFHVPVAFTISLGPVGLAVGPHLEQPVHRRTLYTTTGRTTGNSNRFS